MCLGLKSAFWVTLFYRSQKDFEVEGPYCDCLKEFFLVFSSKFEQAHV